MFGYPYENVDKLIQLPPARRKTYRMDTGREHWMFVPCEEAARHGDCPMYAATYLLKIPVTGADAQDPVAIEQLLTSKGYLFTRTNSDTPDTVGFLIEAGQPCLGSWERPHRLRREDVMPQLTVVAGDHRGNPRGDAPRRHTSPESFMDDLHTHADALVRAQHSAAGPAAGSPRLPTSPSAPVKPAVDETVDEVTRREDDG